MVSCLHDAFGVKDAFGVVVEGAFDRNDHADGPIVVDGLLERFLVPARDRQKAGKVAVRSCLQVSTTGAILKQIKLN